jgi:hypothetical protein
VQHLLVCLQELVAGLQAKGARKLGGTIGAAELYGFAEAFGKLDARRTAGEMRFHIPARIRRKL